jgi:hypothetical protein
LLIFFLLQTFVPHSIDLLTMPRVHLSHGYSQALRLVVVVSSEETYEFGNLDYPSELFSFGRTHLQYRNIHPRVAAADHGAGDGWGMMKMTMKEKLIKNFSSQSFHLILFHEN